MSTGEQTTGKGAFGAANCQPDLGDVVDRSRQIVTVGIGLGVIAFQKAKEHRKLLERRLIDYSR